MAFHIINLVPVETYRRDSYGILLESETVHRFVGPGIHNSSHDHVLEVWENRIRYDDKLVDPSGQPTTERYSYRFAPQASVISAHPGEPALRGASMQLGDLVELRIHGMAVALIRVHAKPYHDPHGVIATTGQEA